MLCSYHNKVKRKKRKIISGFSRSRVGKKIDCKGEIGNLLGMIPMFCIVTGVVLKRLHALHKIHHLHT